MSEKGDYTPQSRQIARLFLQSSKLGPPRPHPTPSPAGEFVPTPLVPGEGTHSLAGEGEVGGSQFGRGDRPCGTLGISVLCAIHCTYRVHAVSAVSSAGRIDPPHWRDTGMKGEGGCSLYCVLPNLLSRSYRRAKCCAAVSRTKYVFEFSIENIWI